jgi:hypothetical protein
MHLSDCVKILFLNHYTTPTELCELGNESWQYK